MNNALSNTRSPVSARTAPPASQSRFTMNWVSYLMGWPTGEASSAAPSHSSAAARQAVPESAEATMPRPGALVFNDVERQIQQRAQVPDKTIWKYERFIRPAMPEEHQDFFHSRTVIYVSVQQPGQAPIAAMIAGPAGFISCPSATELHFDLSSAAVCGASVADFVTGAQVGLLGLEHEPRRRNRANGLITHSTASAIGAAPHATPAFTMAVEQSFGNCPKYIQKRNIAFDAAAAPATADVPAAGVANGALTEAMADIVRQADTFFIASNAGAAAGGAASTQGTDVSHRGGGRGFVEVGAGGARLRWPDFRGNDFFMTLGNIAASGHVSLLFPDYETGALLRAEGAARIDWEATDLPGAQRTIVFDVAKAAWWGPGSVPITHSDVKEWSPHNPEM
eukprot:jgi/Ulvmu1/2788/UM140_0018.1